MVEIINNIGIGIIGLYRTNYLNRFHVREMAKLIKKSHVGLLPYLKKFEKNNILKSQKSGKNKIYTLNLENNQVKTYISLAEKAISLEFIKKDFFVKKLYDETTNLDITGCFVIFGSFASGKQTNRSDIDIFYIGTITEKQKKTLENFSKTYKKDLHFISMTSAEFRGALQKNMELMKEIIKNHIIINNHDIFINELWRYYYGKKE